ncbi:ABC transporter permease [Dehalogenimonas alkenigignens]|uniref:ABC-type dipeptide/oligopeptide/nickel transport system, permease component n=1 Tax=Dehalogenimonas alkenigignens TaxID=1217799 RepID=A0A0W0GKR3_9CHLR|nr:ABC transporter permease [Dehalogenimonas alkenigignens]KTB49151.1 ABC-type dipeptide/oligopeptide/nickel transport system, permease component [Dehalogenimonas alkenigignens]PVV83663.1 ABC transporter permease [Dehalogenimonas alkenigignens]
MVLKLLGRGLTLFGVLVIVLLMVVVSLGATGFSDRMLESTVSEEIRAYRTTLSQTIRDPEVLEATVAQRRAELEAFYHLDQPWYTRLPDTIKRVVTFDLGEARTLRTTEGSPRVADLLAERLGNTILLITTASVITSILGLLIGPRLAARAGTRLDRAACLALAVSYALPAWWVGIFFVLFFAFEWGIFPYGGLLSAPPPDGALARLGDMAWHAALPVAALVVVSFGSWAYAVRTMVLNTAQEPFVTVGKAKGLPQNLIERRYILRAAAPPIVTSLILGLAGSLGGAILTETVFNWPGMGRLYYDAIIAADETVIVALTFVFTLIYLAARFVLEVLYLWLDPRIRYT